MSCADLCTAAKCRELEARIGALEQALELLEASFEAHTNQDIPEAHDYQPPEPENQHIESNLRIDGSFQSDTLTITVADGESQDTTQINIPLPEIPEPTEHVESNLSISASWQSEILTISVADGESQDTAQVNIPLPESDQHVESNLRISGSYYNQILTLSVADGESQDTDQVRIPVNDSPQTIFITEEVYMNCDDLTRELEDCCSELKNLITVGFQDLTNNLTTLENALREDITDVFEEVTIDISGSANGDYSCEFPIDEETLSTIPSYATSQVNQKSYAGRGLSGIHEKLKLLATNLDAIHNDVCKAVDPITRLTVEDLYQFCDRSLINREDFDPDFQGQQEYEAAVAEYFRQLFADTKYADLVANATDNVLINAPNNWVTPILADFALIQGRINNNLLCNISDREPDDVVSIVASDKVIPNATGKFLVLHFVTLDNYPKRSRNSTYYPIQIPAAKDTYDWDIDFRDLIWERGNQYAELRFEQFKNPVSGFFRDKEAAYAYFNAVLNLTTATEKNRVVPQHENPQTAVIERTTRPYRAFISSVNSDGRVVCHVKYVPTDEADNNG